MTSIARVMDVAIAIPDFSCISKRTVELSVILLTKAMKPGSVVIVESTGLKVYGKDEWHQEKHAVPARRTWQRESGYNLRSHVELAMQRYKRIFGNTMKAHALAQQKTQARISASALNRMTNLGIPISVKI